MKISLVVTLVAVIVGVISLAGCEQGDSGKIILPETPSGTEVRFSSAGTTIRVVENIRITDLPQVGSSAVIRVVESIGVNDLPQALLSATIGVAENIGVTDSPTVTPGQQSAPVQPLSSPKLVSPGSSSSPGPIINSLTPNLQWSSVTGADNYGIYIFDIASKSIIFNSQAQNITIKGTAYTLPPGVLQWGRSYYWYMKSHNSAGWGDNSAVLYFQTPKGQ